MASSIDAFADDLEALCLRHWGKNWDLHYDFEDGSYIISLTAWKDEDDEEEEQ